MHAAARSRRLAHHQTWGLDYYSGTTDFESAAELAQFRDDRSTTRSGLFAVEEATELATDMETVGLYWLDRINPLAKLSVTLSLRYNNSRIQTRDESGDRPDLDGDHRFRQLNGAVGFTYLLSPATDVHAGVHQSARDAVLVTNMVLTYQPVKTLAIFLVVNNLFDRETESFGLYGEAGEILPALDNEGNRFLSPNKPRGAWLGLRYRWD